MACGDMGPQPQRDPNGALERHAKCVEYTDDGHRQNTEEQEARLRPDDAGVREAVGTCHLPS